MGFSSELSLCPSCGYFSLRVLESRKSKLARRRRYSCDKCSHRATTHEVTDQFFQEAKENVRIIEKLKEMLGATEQSSNQSRCDECQHNSNGFCSFDFPEFGTPDSFDCNHFES